MVGSVFMKTKSCSNEWRVFLDRFALG